MNLPLLGSMLALLAVGVVFIYSAVYGLSTPAGAPRYEKQIWWIVIGLACFVGFATTDYHYLLRYAWLFYFFGLLLLALIFVPHVGLKNYGATRWIHLGGMGFFQPSELMKIFFVFLLARLFGYPGRRIRRWRYSLAGAAAAVVPAALIIRQPDLGTAFVFLPVLLCVMFASGVPGRIIGVFAGVCLAAGLVFVSAIVLPPRLGFPEQAHRAMLERVGVSAYQRERILVFFDSSRDPLGSGWNKAQSKIAVGSGGLLGKGYLRGTQNILGFLPRQVAPTDFVYAVIAEETGFVGAAAVLFLCGGLMYGAMQSALRAGDKMGRLLCVGLGAMLFCHIFINIAMTIGLVPVTGIPLPLVSYGGTFMVGTMSALGIIQSVHIRGDWK